MRTPYDLSEELQDSANGMLTIHEPMMAAIGADHSQRDIYELIAESLDERAEMGGGPYLSDPQAMAAQYAAAIIRAGEEEDIWDRFIGPMLDALETLAQDHDSNQRCDSSTLH